MASTLWTKESAEAEARNLAEETKRLAKGRPYSEEHTRWLFRVSRFLRDVFGENSPYYKSISSLSWEYKGTFMAFGDPAPVKEKKDQQAYLRQLDFARGVFLDAADQIKRVGIDAVYEGKNTAPESSAIVKVLNLADAKLRKVIREKPSKEKDVQDAFENLLIGAEIPYSREMDRIEYSSKTYVPDFTMPKIDLATEIKFCNREDREKEIIAEINDDILAYGTKYGNLIFIIYDLGFIRDAERFAKSFEERESVLVRVVKH